MFSHPSMSAAVKNSLIILGNIGRISGCDLKDIFLSNIYLKMFSDSFAKMFLIFMV